MWAEDQHITPSIGRDGFNNEGNERWIVTLEISVPLVGPTLWGRIKHGLMIMFGVPVIYSSKVTIPLVLEKSKRRQCTSMRS